MPVIEKCREEKYFREYILEKLHSTVSQSVRRVPQVESENKLDRPWDPEHNNFH